MLEATLPYWMAYAPVIATLGPIVMATTWKRGSWWILDGVAFLLPGLLWLLLVDEDLAGEKSLSNMIEMPLVGVVVACFAIWRSRLVPRVPRLVASAAFLAMGALTALAFAWWFPPLPE